MLKGKKIIGRIFLGLASCLALMAGIISCGKNEFSAATASQSNTLPTATEYTTTTCANATVLKPKVDVVILWPNTAHAASWVNGSIKRNLLGLFDIISLYDYRIIGLPLIGNGWNDAVVASSDGKPFGNFPKPVPLDELAADIMGFTTFNDAEAGIDRLNFVARSGSSQGQNVWHRSEAYTIFILASFMDDGTRLTNYNVIDEDIKSAVEDFKGYLRQYFKGNNNFLFSYINTTGTTCFQYASKGVAYENFTNQSGIGYTKDICYYNNDDFFGELENKLQNTIIAHKYDYWLVTTDRSDNINKSTIQVYEHTSDITNLVNAGRYTITDYKDNQNTRCAPTAGEPRSGIFIKFPSCEKGISYPSCLSVTYTGKPVCYQYVVINNEPAVNTIRIWINGQETNQFTYEGRKYMTDIATDCEGFNNHTPETKTGYFIRLGQPYESGQSMKVTYKGAAKQ